MLPEDFNKDLALFSRSSGPLNRNGSYDSGGKVSRLQYFGSKIVPSKSGCVSECASKVLNPKLFLMAGSSECTSE